MHEGGTDSEEEDVLSCRCLRSVDRYMYVLGVVISADLSLEKHVTTVHRLGKGGGAELAGPPC